MPCLKITLTRSPIGYEESQKATVRALGLTRMHMTVERPDNPQIRGMVEAVRHLLKVEELGTDCTGAGRRRRRG
ncbi:MAG: 50S ribosomal protein L30 [Chthonomonadales bacterium]|nr:50S ribosomal protein L30 [Chthonomonadales bacterium]